MRTFLRKLFKQNEDTIEVKRIDDVSLRALFSPSTMSDVVSLVGWAETLQEHIEEFEDVTDPNWHFTTKRIITTMRDKLEVIEGKYELS